MLKKILLIFGFILTSYFSISQSYTEDKGDFVKAFHKALNEYGKGEFSDFAKKDLPAMLLETTQFPANYFKKMVETCNLMESKRMSPYPEIYNYVFSVYSFVKGKQSTASYDIWHAAIDKLLASKNNQKFEDFVGFSGLFFSKQIISDNANFDWYYVGGTFSFEYTDKPLFKCVNGTLACRVINNDQKTMKEFKFVDSLVISNTSGSYDPMAKRWVGSGGSLDWEKVGLSKKQTSAVLTNYEISTRVSNFSCDSVTLTTPYFSKPIKGRI